MRRIEKCEVIRPELVTCKHTQTLKNFSDCRRRPWRIGIARMPDDAQNTVFSQWTGRPRGVTDSFKPRMGTVMLHMPRIEKGDQDIDVQKKPAHGNSSRNF